MMPYDGLALTNAMTDFVLAIWRAPFTINDETLFNMSHLRVRAYARILLAYKKKTSHFSHFSHQDLGGRMRATLIPLGVRSVRSVG